MTTARLRTRHRTVSGFSSRDNKRSTDDGDEDVGVDSDSRLDPTRKTGCSREVLQIAQAESPGNFAHRPLVDAGFDIGVAHSVLAGCPSPGR